MTNVLLRGVSKTFGTTKAVIGLDFHAPRGALTMLTGPSGSGKSTTLRLIAGLDRPDAGTIHFDDEEVTFRPAHGREAAVVFQTPGLFPRATVRRNWEAALQAPWPFRLFAGTKRQPSSGETRRQVDATARLLALEPLLDRLPEQLSGGERQRAALGRALIQRPQVLLLDEPLVHLDPELRFELRREIRRRQRADNLTVIWITHDPGEALAVADRVGFMHGGRLLQTGSPAELYDTPADVRIAKAFGPRPMNLVRGVWSRETGTFRAGDWEFRPPGGSRPQTTEADIVLGVRPEDLRLTAANDAGEALGTGMMVGSEFAGDRTFVAIELANGGPTLEVVVAERTRPTSGEPVTVRRERMHWFASGGERIELG